MTPKTSINFMSCGCALIIGALLLPFVVFLIAVLFAALFAG